MRDRVNAGITAVRSAGRSSIDGGRRRRAAGALLALVAAACGGGERHRANADTTLLRATDSLVRVPAEIDTNPAAIKPAMVALGDSIFHGQVGGGNCMACHGPDGKGTPLAPDLTDATWLNGDGSFRFIITTIITGVAAPRVHPGPMPPMGGATLSPAQIEAVAAYVYWFRHARIG